MIIAYYIVKLRNKFVLTKAFEAKRPIQNKIRVNSRVLYLAKKSEDKPRINRQSLSKPLRDILKHRDGRQRKEKRRGRKTDWI